jgi:hypothetical protein
LNTPLTDDSASEEERGDKQHEENKEQQLRNACGSTRNATKPQESGNHSNDQEK